MFIVSRTIFKPRRCPRPWTALTLLDHPSTKTAAYDRIWPEIALEASIVALNCKRQHNTPSVVARLPVEVL
ncbi:hypothetical protein C0995_012030 [Termitomyces sp. Mi166|nr:hypothetical protein C0995_012030 [Termitomyces sp. Mi166\